MSTGEQETNHDLRHKVYSIEHAVKLLTEQQLKHDNTLTLLTDGHIKHDSTLFGEPPDYKGGLFLAVHDLKQADERRSRQIGYLWSVVSSILSAMIAGLATWLATK